MLNIRALFTSLVICFLFANPVSAEQVNVGGDTYSSGENAVLSGPSPRDAFVSGFNADVNARVEKDVHAAGFDVNLNAPIGGDAYAAGFSVEVTQPVGDDLSVSAFNVAVKEKATIGGNARLAGRTINIDSPITGSIAAAAGDLTLNNVVYGDAVLTVGSLKFGTNAKINGKLTYYATEPITIPASVISADRIQFNKLTVSNATEAVRQTSERSLPAFWPSFLGIISGFVLLIGFLVAVGAVMLAFAPERMERLKAEALHAPIKIMALGVLGLSMAIGLVPVSGMTLVGIPLIPVAILITFVLWIVGYVVGAYSVGMRMIAGFRDGSASTASKLLVLVVAVTVLSLLNFIPILGWLINLAVLFLGLGAIMMRTARLITHEESHVTETVIINPIIETRWAEVPKTEPRAKK
jgi:hypothetical protein